MDNFDIRNYNDILDILNVILSQKGIAELKIEKGCTPVVVEIKRQKRYPPKANS